MYTYPSESEWTTADAEAANAEGWNIWDCIGSLYGRTQLCRNDEDEIFAHDNEVWVHVWLRAQAGSVLHVKALAIIERHNPTEFACIKKYVSQLV